MRRILALTAVLLSLAGTLLPWELFVGEPIGSPATFLELRATDHVLFAVSLVCGLWCALQPNISQWLLAIPAYVATLCLVAIAAMRRGIAMWDGFDELGNMTGGQIDILPGPGAWLGLAAAALYFAYGFLTVRQAVPRRRA